MAPCRSRLPSRIARSRGSSGPFRICSIGCGLLYALALPAFFVYGGEIRARQADALMPMLVLLVSLPHYGATLLRVYEEKEDRRRYRRHAVYSSLLLLATFVDRAARAARRERPRDALSHLEPVALHGPELRARLDVPAPARRARERGARTLPAPLLHLLLWPGLPVDAHGRGNARRLRDSLRRRRGALRRLRDSPPRLAAARRARARRVSGDARCRARADAACDIAAHRGPDARAAGDAGALVLASDHGAAARPRERARSPRVGPPRLLLPLDRDRPRLAIPVDHGLLRAPRERLERLRQLPREGRDGRHGGLGAARSWSSPPACSAPSPSTRASRCSSARPRTSITSYSTA